MESEVAETHAVSGQLRLYRRDTSALACLIIWTPKDTKGELAINQVFVDAYVLEL